MTAEVEFEGQGYSASYCIEHNVTNANIGGRLMLTSLTSVPAEKTVQALLMGYLFQTQRKSQQTVDWQGP